MAKVKETLAAGRISGRMGGVIYFQVPGRGPETYARTYNPEVKQPRTPFQQRNRMLMRGMASLWKTLSSAEKGSWKQAAAPGQTGWIAFCAYNYGQAMEGWMPQVEKHALNTGAPVAPTELAARASEHSLSVTWTDAVGALTTGIHVGAAPDFTPAMSNLVACAAATAGAPRQASILLAPGSYFVKARSGAADGGTGAVTGVVGPVEVG